MATFLEECKALLTSDRFERLQFLTMKANQFETSQDEDEEIQEIKQDVRQAIFDRDRLKNLEFLKDPSIKFEDIIDVKKPSKKQLQAAIKKLYPAGSGTETATAPIATIGYKASGVDKIHDLKMNARIDMDSRAVGEAIKTLGVKGFVKSLTDFGKSWITENYVSDSGPFQGKTIYPNINAVSTRFKFDKSELRKELKIKD